MLIRNLKSLIKYAIELDIEYIETFLGYQGDNVLRISARNAETIKLLEEYAKKLDLDYKSEYKLVSEHGGSYNIYIGVEDPSIFKLKRDH